MRSANWAIAAVLGVVAAMAPGAVAKPAPFEAKIAVGKPTLRCDTAGSGRGRVAVGVTVRLARARGTRLATHRHDVSARVRILSGKRRLATGARRTFAFAPARGGDRAAAIRRRPGKRFPFAFWVQLGKRDSAAVRAAAGARGCQRAKRRLRVEVVARQALTRSRAWPKRRPGKRRKVRPSSAAAHARASVTAAQAAPVATTAVQTSDQLIMVGADLVYLTSAGALSIPAYAGKRVAPADLVTLPGPSDPVNAASAYDNIGMSCYGVFLSAELGRYVNETGCASDSLNDSDAPSSAAVGDFNGDGKPDLLAGPTNGGTVQLMQYPYCCSATVGTNGSGDVAAVAAGSFLTDGLLDVATAQSSPALLSGQGDVTTTISNSVVQGSMGAWPTFNPGYGYGLNYPGGGSLAGKGNHISAAGLAVADFNLDGHPDMATATTDCDAGSDGECGSLSGSVATFINSGDFSNPNGGSLFGDSTDYNPVGGGGGSLDLTVNDVASADFNGDGWPDLASVYTGTNSSNSGVSVQLNQYATQQMGVDAGFTGGYVVVSGSALGNATDVVAADVNADGQLDLVAVTQSALVFLINETPKDSATPRFTIGQLFSPPGGSVSGSPAFGNFGVASLAAQTGAFATSSASWQLALFQQLTD
jgi:hypothetical protein